MANIENIGKSTRFKSGKEAAEAGRKGGKASGISKAKVKSMRETAQAILSGKYTDKDGNEQTGQDMIIATLFTIATTPDHKQCISAMRLLREISGDDITPEQAKLTQKKIEQLEAEIEYRKKATDELGY